MSILVVSPSSPTPGLYLKVDLKPRGVSGSGVLRILVIAPANSSGASIVANAAPVQVTDDAHAATLGGIGSLGSIAFQAIRDVNKTIPVYLSAPAESAGAAATGSFAFASAPISDQTFRLRVQGRHVDVSWLVGEAVNDARTRALAKLAELTGSVHALFTAAVGDGVITVTAPATGPTGNDVKISTELLDGAGGTCTASGAALTGGTTEVDITDSLAAANGDQYDYIVAALSNAAIAATTGNLATLETHLLALDEGPNALLQQGVVGCTNARTAVAASALARNEQVLEIMCAQSALSLPIQVGCYEAGDRANFRSLYTSYNRIGNRLPIAPPLAITAENPTTAQSDAALNAGVSYCYYTTQGETVVGRAVTTYTVSDQGAQLRPTDCNEIDAMHALGSDLRIRIQSEYQNCFIMKDSDVAEGEDVPARTVQESDVRATLVSRMLTYWCRGNRGVFNGGWFQAQVDAGTLVVEVNVDDESQVDLFIPAKPNKVWAKTGLLVSKGA